MCGDDPLTLSAWKVRTNMKHGLYISLEVDILEGLNLTHMIVEFPTEQEATAFAARIVRAEPTVFGFAADGNDLIMDDGELVEMAQSSLFGLEHFHVYPIISPDAIPFPTSTPTPMPITDEMQQLTDASKGG